jgi:hypothetical protein
MAIKPIDESKVSHKGSADRIRKLKVAHPDMPVKEIARRAKCTIDNVYSVLKRFLGRNSPEQLKQYQEHKADIFDAVGMQALLSITPAKLAKANVVQAATVFGIAFDKSQLARGQATGINVSILMDVVEAIKARKASEQESYQRSINMRQVVDMDSVASAKP